MELQREDPRRGSICRVRKRQQKRPPVLAVPECLNEPKLPVADCRCNRQTPYFGSGLCFLCLPLLFYFEIFSALAM